MRLKSVTFIFVLFYLLCFFSFNNLFQIRLATVQFKAFLAINSLFFKSVFIFYMKDFICILLFLFFFLEGMCKCQPKVPSESTRGLQSKLRQTEDLAINSSILSFISNSSD